MTIVKDWSAGYISGRSCGDWGRQGSDTKNHRGEMDQQHGNNSLRGECLRVCWAKNEVGVGDDDCHNLGGQTGVYTATRYQ